MCTAAAGKTIGVELTKWVEHDQIEGGRGRELLENSYLKILAAKMSQDLTTLGGSSCTTNHSG